jgi:hypothetical protein
VEGVVEMSADTRELFSAGDGRLTMREAAGWVLTTVTDGRGHITHRARISLSELRSGLKQLSRLGAGRADLTIDLFLGFTPEGDHLCAAVTQTQMAIVEVSADGIVRRLLCGPYPGEQVRVIVQAVISASKK